MAGCSRQSVQDLYAELGKRVEFIMEGNFPDMEKRDSAELMTPEMRGAVRSLSSDFERIGRLYAPLVSYEDYAEYRRSGATNIKARDSALQFHHYNLYRTLHSLSSLAFGITEKNFGRHLAYCRFRYLMGVLVITLEEDGYFPEMNESERLSEAANLCSQILVLSFCEDPLDKGSSE